MRVVAGVYGVWFAAMGLVLLGGFPLFALAMLGAPIGWTLGILIWVAYERMGRPS